MATVDVTMRGAGIFGLSVAWACVLRGARVRIVDPAGVGAGASGGIVGALAPHVPENWNSKKAFQLESLLMAGPFWAGVEEASGMSAGYARTGRLQPVLDAQGLALARARSDGAAALWNGHATWEVIRAERAGWAPLSPTEYLVRDTLSARIHPRRACESLAAALGARGCPVLADAPEEGLVVHATGWSGLATLSEALGSFVGTGVKGQAVLLRHAAPPDAPQLFADGLHIVPHGDGTVAIGSTTERMFDAPDTVDASADDLIDRAIEQVPILHGAAIISRWAGVRPRARSRAPILGPWPDRPGHFIANGGFKIGFGMAPKIAEVMADLVLDGRDGVPDAFRIEASLPG